MTPSRLPALLPSAKARAGQGVLEGLDVAFGPPNPAAAPRPEAGLHARLLADVQSGTAGMADAVVLAYAAYLLTTWHVQGLAALDPDADPAGAEQQADTWTRAVLAYVKARPRAAGAADAELIGTAVQLLVQFWPDEALDVHAGRLAQLAEKGDFHHVETAFVLRDLVAPQLSELGQAGAARQATGVAHALLCAHWPLPTAAEDGALKMVSPGY